MELLEWHVKEIYLSIYLALSDKGMKWLWLGYMWFFGCGLYVDIWLKFGVEGNRYPAIYLGIDYIVLELGKLLSEMS